MNPGDRADLPVTPLLLALLLAGPLTSTPTRAQVLTLPATHGPATTELAGASALPLMGRAARVQQFYGPGEVGASRLIANRMSFRFDGPTHGARRQHVIERLTIRIGATGKAIDQLGSGFDDNLTAPLSTVVSARRVNFVTDGTGTVGPEPFGGMGGQLGFALSRPTAVEIPAGGCLAVELVVAGNSNTAGDPAMLDFAADPSALAPVPGTWSGGRGCPAATGGPPAMLMTTGNLRPGGSFSVHGDGYPPHAPVFTIVTARLLDDRLALPGTTPICWLYVDEHSGGVLMAGTTDGTGRLQPNGDDNVLPLPRTPSTSGGVLYVQNVAPAPRSPDNQFGFISSNYRTVRIEQSVASSRGVWHCASPTSATAAVATAASYGAYALRIE